jgi:opacity protein-like surface antigen
MHRTARLLLITALALPGLAAAGVLPEERADALYHFYTGGGVEVQGPSILVRKNIGKSVAVTANYYMDTISSASIDVLMSRASRYSEERREITVGADYLHGDTTMSFSYTNSRENDYLADSWNLGVSQEVFGGLTTISMSYGRGNDDVGKTGDSSFSQRADHWHWRLGVSQVVTRNLLMGLSYEAMSDQGFLNNPYRQVRYLDPTDTTRGYSLQDEIYPRSRNSNAVSLRGRYFLPWRAALHGDYRFFSDSWGINAHSAEFGITQPWNRWTFEGSYRFHTQNSASFYSDLFPYANAQNYMARDKQLASFVSHDIRIGAAYEFPLKLWGFGEKGSANLFYDHIIYSYGDFRDITGPGGVGNEPFYEYTADVVQFFFSFFF